MADQAEQAFATAFLNTLSSQPVTFADDYQQPPENSLKKVPILSIDIPAPPMRKQNTTSTSLAGTLSITVKSLKPPASFTLSVQSTDTISAIKSQLASQASAPPADAQRLLLKGKALVDTKLLKEYNVKDGDIVNLMVKPGFHWDPTKPTISSSPQPMDISTSPTSTPSLSRSPSITLVDPEKSKAPGRRHQRIPSVVLSPSPSSELPAFDKPVDIMLALGTPATYPTSTYHATVAKPEFWDRLMSFLRSEFINDGDALLAFEDFLRATKSTLTASEIAKIRDQVGIIGMGGT